MSEENIGNDRDLFPLTNLSEQLLAFMRIANAMLEATELNQILAALTREVSRVINFDRSSVAFMSADRTHLILQNIHKGESAAEKFGEGRAIPIDEDSVIGWVCLHQKPIMRNNIEEATGFNEVVSEETLRSDIIVPLITHGELIGTLNIGTYRANAFTDTDFEVMENCGKFAGLAIEHTTLRLKAVELGDRYKTLQENANDIIMIIDRNTGKLVEVNRRCERDFGYTREELLKKSFFDLFAHEDQHQARRDFIHVLSEKSMQFVDRRMIGRDGSIIFVDINANMIRLKEDFFIQMIVHNVSERKMLEQQIIYQNKNLHTVNKKLTEVDQMKTEFLANISHELRTPLSIIIAYSESLRGDNMSPEDREQFLDVIAENGGNLLTLINNLLDLSKLEISGKKLDISLSHVHDVLKSIWPQMEKRAEQNGITLTLTQDPTVPVTYFDNKQLVMIFKCLIQNAIKFTESGGSVSVKTTNIGEEIWVQVQDTGMGIKPDEINSIFGTFHQVDGSSSRKTGGLGIGLTIAKHIAELHKGRLWVESEYGEGSLFTLALPIDTEEIFRLSAAAVIDDSPKES